jgi:putative FmdB family regulatory protein
MPLYEYQCKDCGASFDSLRSMKDSDSPIPCKECHSQETARKISTFNASSGGRAVTHSTGGGCAGCSGASCAGCSH